MSKNDLTPQELIVYDEFVNKWMTTAQAAGIDNIQNAFADREGIFHTIYPEVLNVAMDETTALHVALALIDEIPLLLGAESLKIEGRGEGKLVKSEGNLDLRKFAETREFDGKEYTKCTGMGLSGSIGAGFEVIRRDSDSWVPSKRYNELKDLMKDIKLDLKKKSWDMGGQKSEDYHPGSNTGPIPYKMPKHPGDIPPESSTTFENYFNKSLLEREEEEHSGVSNRNTPGGGGQSLEGTPGIETAVDNNPSNKLRPFKHMPIPPERYRQDFNTGFDTEYVQRQYGELSLKRIKQGEFDQATIQLSDIPQSLIKQIKVLQKQISKEILNTSMDNPGWIDNGIQQNFHITVLFGIKDNDSNKVKDIFKEFDTPITIETDGIEYFNPGKEEKTVAVLRCKSEALKKLHEKLRDNIKNTHRKGEFKAHITIAYLEKGEKLPNETIKKVTWDVNKLEVSKSSGNIETISKKVALSLKRIKQADDTNPPGLENVCAWCKSSYDSTTGLPIRPLTEDEYNTVQSHGICKQCADQQIQEMRKQKLGAEGFPQSWFQHILKTLVNPTTTESVIWQIVLAHNTAPEVLALALKHPNLQNVQIKKTIQTWLNNIDNKTIQDFENTPDPYYNNPYGGDFVPLATEDDFGQEIQPVQPKKKFEFPPESDERREQRHEAPRLTPQEALMLENHSSDEIWSIAQEGDELARALIQRGIIAALKRMRKQALLSWTEPAEDLLTSSKSPRARQILSLIKQEAVAGNLNNVNDVGRVIFDQYPEYRGNANELRRLYSNLINQGYLTDTENPLPEPEKKWWLTEDTPPNNTLLERSPRFTNPMANGIPIEPEPELEPEKISWWKKLFSSVLDAPRDVLDPAIWQDRPDEIPMLRPNIKVKIVQRFFEYLNRFGGYVSPELWVKNMFYTGSTATYRYSDRSDVDIHVVVDWQDMLEANPDKKKPTNEEVWRDLHDTFWWTLNKLQLEGTKHPIQYYVVKPGEEKGIIEQKEEIYDIGHDVWLIPPEKALEMPEEVLQVAINNASDIMHKIDEQMSNARQGLIDYALLAEVITPENAKDVYNLLAEKTRQVDKHLKEMKAEYDKLKMSRQEAFTDHTMNSNFSLDNVIFKLVERYKYLDVLRKVKRLTDSLDLKPDQMPDIADALGLGDIFE